MAIEALIHQVLQLPADERVELLERLIDSLDDVEISADELAQLDEVISDADHAVERGELIPADAVLASCGRSRSSYRVHMVLTALGRPCEVAIRERRA